MDTTFRSTEQGPPRGTKVRIGLRFGRRVALVLAAGWCVMLGAGTTAFVVGEDALAQTNTLALLGVVAMLVLPAATALVLHFDARERRRMDVIHAAETSHTMSQRSPRRGVAHPPHTEAPRQAPRRETGDRRLRIASQHNQSAA